MAVSTSDIVVVVARALEETEGVSSSMTSTPSAGPVPYNVSDSLGRLTAIFLNASSTLADRAITSSTLSPYMTYNTSVVDGDVPLNDTGQEANKTGFGPPWKLTVYSKEHLIGTSVVLGIMILCCIIGNCFVIAAVILERSLHNVANYLILSLAVADLMVAVLVMPLSVVSEISRVWFLSQEVCDMWISFDVLCCTASILHLVAIALDRYWAVTSIDYIRRRSAKRILMMIVVVWTVALTISIPPLFGWRDPNNDPDITGVCIISQDHGYTVFSTVGAFYLPMFIMILIYTRIYMVARARIRREKFNKNKAKNGATTTGSSRPTEHINLTVTRPSPPEYSVVSNCNGNCSPPEPERKGGQNHDTNNGHAKDRGNSDDSGDNDSRGGGDGGGGSGKSGRSGGLYTNGITDDPPTTVVEEKSPGGADGARKPCLPFSRQREKLEQRRERKAARTLAIITSCFLLCWLPFFIMALAGPFIRDKVHVPEIVMSLLLWLGYLNSGLNPVIYTIFSPEFRNAFRKILFGKYSRKHLRGGRF